MSTTSYDYSILKCRVCCKNWWEIKGKKEKEEREKSFYALMKKTFVFLSVVVSKIGEFKYRITPINC